MMAKEKLILKAKVSLTKSEQEPPEQYSITIHKCVPLR